MGEAAANLIDLNPYLAAIMLVVDILEWTGIIPDPIDLLIQAFAGRPRALSTIQVGSTLAKARNPAARVWGMEILKMLRNRDIVLSSSNAADQHLIGQTRAQFIANLTNAGFTPAQAKQAADTIETKLEHLGPLEYQALNHAPDAAAHIWGDQNWRTLYNEGIQKYDPVEHPKISENDYATRYALQRARVEDMLTLWIAPIPPPPGWPTGPGGGGGGGGGGGPGPGTQEIDWQPLIDGLCKCFSEDIGTPISEPLALLAQALPALKDFLNWEAVNNIKVDLDKLIECVCKDIPNAIAKAADATSVRDLLEKMIDRMDRSNVLADLPPDEWNHYVERFQLPAEFAGVIQGSGGPSTRAGVELLKLATSRGSAAWDKLRFGAKYEVANSLFPLLENVGIAYKGLMAKYGATLRDDAAAVWNTLKPIFLDIIQGASTAAEELPKAVLEITTTLVMRDGIPNPETAEDIGFRVLGFAFLVGQIVHFGVDIFSKVFWPVSSVFSHNAEIAVELLGYEAITREIHQAFFRNAFGQHQRYRYQRQFRPTRPNAATAAEMFSRRIIDEGTFASLAADNGYHPAFEKALAENSYRAVSPFLVARELGLINADVAALVDLLRFQGLREKDVQPTIDGLTNAGLLRILTPLIGQIVTSASKGLMSDAEISAAFDALNVTHQAQQILMQHIATVRHEKLTTEFKSELDIMVADGAITLDEYRSQLQALGLQSEEISVYSGIADAKLQRKVLTEEARAASEAARDVARHNIEAAIVSFRKGEIEATTLAGLLATQGLNPLQVAAHTALAVVQTKPTRKVGSTPSPFVQKQQTTALEIKAAIESYKKGLTATETLRARLSELGMPDGQITAEIAYLDALSAKKVAAPGP